MDKVICQVHKTEPVVLLDRLTKLALKLHALSVQAEAYINRPVAPMDRKLQRLSARLDQTYATAVRQGFPLGQAFKTLRCSGRPYYLTLTSFGIELDALPGSFTPCPRSGQTADPNRSRRA